MKPYYNQDGITIYHADCRDLHDIPALDVSVLDPPFDAWMFAPVFGGRTQVCFTTFQHRCHVEDRYGRIPRAELVWAFLDGRWTSHSLPRTTHETIMVYGESGPVYVGENQSTEPQRKGNGAIGRDKLGQRTYTPRERKALNSVLFYPRNVSGPLGCWGKPITLMVQLLEWVGGESVIDPFMGSGTTLVAAKQLGRNAIGIEIEERYCEIAANRLQQGVLPIVHHDSTQLEML